MKSAKMKIIIEEVPDDMGQRPKLDPNDFDVAMYETESKRLLQADNTTSTATGNGTVALEPFTEYTVTVTARDSASVLRGAGGDYFFVRIQNECTYSNQTT